MPVHFKGTSEYEKHYKWQGSFRSKSFEPSAEQAAERAGQASVSSSLTIEPPLQHKKRLGGPQTSLSTNFFCVPSSDSDFALLGQQDKFAKNVRYQPKPTFSNEKIYKNKENIDDAPPPSKQLKMQKRTKQMIKESQSVAPPASPPPAPREPKEGLKDKDLQDVLGKAASKENMAAVSASESNMNEFVQTNMKKGVTLSGSEAPAEYALKYKAGVAPPRPVKKFSEYQRQFQWAKGVKASPLLAADEIVYQSHADLGPYKTEAIPKKSEYQLQFQKWKLPEYSADLNYNLDKTPDVQKELKKKTSKRSKSAGATLQKPVEEEVELVEAPSSEDQLKEKLPKSHGKLKRMGSEYRTNFKSPTKFNVVNGAWRGAAPPQLYAPDSPVVDSNNNAVEDANNNAEEKPLSNWFAEVLELRRRAKEYSKRARGTHFSREHLVQLMAKQNECWDISSSRSSTLSALNLEAPAAGITSLQKSDDNPPETTEAKQDDLNFEEQIDVSEEIKPTEPKKREKSKSERLSRKMAWLEEQKEKVAEQHKRLEELQKQELEADDDLSEAGCGVKEEGRLPTPKIKASGSAARHHLDLTTPSVGGALLTCPPAKSAHLIVTSRSGDSYVTMSDDVPVNNQEKQEKFDLDTLVTVPAGGKLTVDTHALQDDEAESDRGLVTKYIASPLLASEDKENKGQKKRKAKKASNLSTIKESQGKTYLNLEDIRASTGVNKQDDDVLSVSLQSVASSGSLASQILQRAQNRKEFWNKKQ